MDLSKQTISIRHSDNLESSDLASSNHTPYVQAVKEQLYLSTIPDSKENMYKTSIKTLKDFDQALLKFAKIAKRNTPSPDQILELPKLQFQNSIDRSPRPTKSLKDIHKILERESSDEKPQKIIKKLISSRKFYHSNPTVYKNVQESPVKRLKDQRNMHQILFNNIEDQKDKNMRAGIKYLRNLGQNRRQMYDSFNDDASQNEQVFESPKTCDDRGIRKQKSLQINSARQHRTSVDLSLMDYYFSNEMIELDDMEQFYVEQAKEYRQHDEKVFEAFQKKYREERRMSARLPRYVQLNEQSQMNQDDYNLERIPIDSRNRDLVGEHKKVASITKLHLIVESSKDEEQEVNQTFPDNYTQQQMQSDQITESLKHLGLKPQTSRNKNQNYRKFDEISNSMNVQTSKFQSTQNFMMSSQEALSYEQSNDKASQNSLITKMKKQKEFRRQSFQIQTKPLNSLYQISN
eukprot:403341525